MGFSRKHDGTPDAWGFSGPDGKLVRVEISSKADEKKIDRWEHYEAGVLASVDEDTNADGRADKWETYEAGAVRTASMDENGDGRPDRRFTYGHGKLVLIESEPDTAGHFTSQVAVK